MTTMSWSPLLGPGPAPVVGSLAPDGDAMSHGDVIRSRNGGWSALQVDRHRPRRVGRLTLIDSRRDVTKCRVRVTTSRNLSKQTDTRNVTQHSEWHGYDRLRTTSSGTLTANDRRLHQMSGPATSLPRSKSFLQLLTTNSATTLGSVMEVDGITMS